LRSRRQHVATSDVAGRAERAFDAIVSGKVAFVWVQAVWRFSKVIRLTIALASVYTRLRITVSHTWSSRYHATHFQVK
jgi:hypothetical protein